MSRACWWASMAKELSRSTLSIRMRLILVAVLAIVPLLVERVRTVKTDYREHIEATYAHALAHARRGADQQSQFMAVTRGFLEAAAGIYAGAAANGRACEGLLTNVLRGMPWADSISVAGPDGRIVCSSDAGALGRLVDDHNAQRILRSGGFALGDYSFDPQRRRPTLSASYGETTAHGAVERIFVVGLDIGWLFRFAGPAEESGSLVLMLDGAGTVLAHSPGPDQWVGMRLGDDPVIGRMLLGTEGTVAGAGPNHLRRMFAFVELPGTTARIAVGLDEAQVRRAADRAMWLAYIQLGAIAGLVLLAIWFGGERMIVRPIHSLAEAARRFGKGDLGERLGDKPWAAEFAPLVRAMDDMVTELARREEELQHFNARLKRLATVDGLTGLANRREFDAKLKSEWRHAATAGQSLALLMIDVDHFKLYNDHHGHSRGDEALRAVASIVAAAGRRQGDVVARFGGEEFAMILPDADLADALAIAERVRAAVAARGIPHGATPGDVVTVSVGVAAFTPGPGRPLQTLIEAADMALYAAKHRGRNRVAVDDGTVLGRGADRAAPQPVATVDPPAAFVA